MKFPAFGTHIDKHLSTKGHECSGWVYSTSSTQLRCPSPSSTPCFCSCNPSRVTQLCCYRSILSSPAQLRAGFPGLWERTTWVCPWQPQRGLTLPAGFTTTLPCSTICRFRPARSKGSHWSIQVFLVILWIQLWSADLMFLQMWKGNCIAWPLACNLSLTWPTRKRWTFKEDFSSLLTRQDTYCLPFPSSDFTPYLWSLAPLLVLSLLPAPASISPGCHTKASSTVQC